MMRLSLWVSHSLSPQARWWSFCFLPSPFQSRPLLLSLLFVRQQPPSGKTTKMKNHCSPSFFHSSFFLLLEQTPTLSSIPLFPSGLQNSCSPPSLIFPNPKPWPFLSPLIHPKPISFKFPTFFAESPRSVHIV